MGEEIAAVLSAGGGGEFGIWPENWPIAQAWRAIDTQWRAVPVGRGGVYWMGLDYTGVAAGLTAACVDLSAEQWGGLRLMEVAAREALNGVGG